MGDKTTGAWTQPIKLELQGVQISILLYKWVLMLRRALDQRVGLSPPSTALLLWPGSWLKGGSQTSSIRLTNKLVANAESQPPPRFTS